MSAMQWIDSKRDGYPQMDCETEMWFTCNDFKEQGVYVSVPFESLRRYRYYCPVSTLSLPEIPETPIYRYLKQQVKELNESRPCLSTLYYDGRLDSLNHAISQERAGNFDEKLQVE